MSLFNFVKSKLSILDIIGEYVQIKQMGNYWKGRCPFHTEKDASFTVSPDKQIFYCFGCQAGGDLIAFVAKAENLSQIEAVKHLIDQHQLQIPDNIQNGIFKKLNKQKDQKEKYFEMCKAVADWAHKKLLTNSTAKKYLTQRRIEQKQLKYFNIGYFGSGLRFINSFVKDMSSLGILVKDLIEGKILMEGKSTLYSPFEERIIFPIKDVMGRYCGFGGRIFKTSDQRAKYYNSKENEWFSKGKLLFGLDLAKKEIQKQSTAFLVEGYTDCIAMIKHGYYNTIATLGTACTKDHLKTICRYTKTLYVLYDGDQAGQKAILRLTQLCWDVSLELQIIKLSPNHDPASFLYDSVDLVPLVNSSCNIFTFFIESLGEDFFKVPLAEKLNLSEKIVQMISKLDDPFKQELLLQKASSIMQIPFQTLKNLFYKQKKGYLKTYDSHPEKLKNTNKNENNVPLLEERIFSAIINNMGKADKFYLKADLIPYFSEYIQFLVQKLDNFVKKTDNSKDFFDQFLNNLDEIDKNWVIACSLKFEQNVSQNLFDQLIFHFCKQNWKQIVRDMKTKLSKAKQQNDIKKLKELFMLFSKLKKKIQNRGLI